MKMKTVSSMALVSLLSLACADLESSEPGELTHEEEPLSHVEIDVDEEGPSEAEQPRPAPAPLLSQGTEITVTLTETVSTETHEVGAPFTAAVANDVTGPGGVVVLAAGTEVIGTVRASTPSDGPEEDAVLVLAVERLELDGEPTPIHATVTAADVETDQRDSTSETVGKIAVGTAAGAILGRVLGDDSGDALKGAAAGTVAGAVVAYTTRDGHATVSEGTSITVRLDKPVES